MTDLLPVAQLLPEMPESETISNDLRKPDGQQPGRYDASKPSRIHLPVSAYDQPFWLGRTSAEVIEEKSWPGAKPIPWLPTTSMESHGCLPPPPGIDGGVVRSGAPSWMVTQFLRKTICPSWLQNRGLAYDQS